MKSERFTEEPGELTEESLDKLLVVNVSAGTNWERIKNNVEAGVFLRFIVTNDFEIYLAPGSHTHEGMLEDNGLEWKNCMISNGVLRENSGTLLFIYHSASRSALHAAVEKKIIGFLKDRSGIDLSSKKISSIYSTD